MRRPEFRFGVDLNLESNAPKKEKRIKGNYHTYADIRRVKMAGLRLLFENAEKTNDATLLQFYQDKIKPILDRSLQLNKPTNNDDLNQLSNVEEDLKEKATSRRLDMDDDDESCKDSSGPDNLRKKRQQTRILPKLH